jgi:methionine aminopeptidase
MPVLNLHKVKRDSKTRDVEELSQWLDENVGQRSMALVVDKKVVEDTEKYITERMSLYAGSGWEIYVDETSSKSLTEDKVAWSKQTYYVDITDSKQALMFSMKWL